MEKWLSAFFICFEMATTTKSLSATQTGVRYGITEKIARLFMLKIREAMASSENHPMDGDVQVLMSFASELVALKVKTQYSTA